MKRLNELIDCSYDIEISGVKSDSREVEPGDLFVATKGFFCDHFDYVDDAINNGAVAIVADRVVDSDVISVIVSDVNDTYHEILKKFYDEVDDYFNIIGITGTDGKTTTTTIISRLLDDCCYMGTNGCCYKDFVLGLSNTTPDISQIYNIMTILQCENCKNMSMEVSSEALLHKRIDGLQYNIVGFTNITEDHLNIHKTIENYISSKSRLVDLLKNDGIAVFNCDDSNITEIVKKCKCNYYTYGVDESADFRICKVLCNENGSKFEIIFKNNTFSISSPLFGLYNVYNVTLAFIVAYLMGKNSVEIIERIRTLDVISGRFERLDFGQNFTIILDYAHTENGIENILSNIRSIYGNSRIITVTGSAGGREKEKRSGMGKAVFKYSDYSIFTMDDPRYEDVNSIIDDLVGDYIGNNYERIIDRGSAIRRAMLLANEGDVVVILGKGRDNYMAIEDRRLSYSDYDVLKEYFSS